MDDVLMCNYAFLFYWLNNIFLHIFPDVVATYIKYIIKKNLSLTCLLLVLVYLVFQIQGKLFLRIDHKGEGSKWRRTLGQELYSPLLLAFTEQVKERGIN